MILGRSVLLGCLLAGFLGFSPVLAAPFSSIVVDASNGRILQSYRAEQRRHPASLSKMMTALIMLEEIEAGKLRPDTPITASATAAKRPRSKLGLRAGEKIPAHLALKALLVKSANDVATAVAEHISGSESRFAKRMSRTARRLGLRNTYFANASGLYDWQQRTTASDMARLTITLLERYPHFESLWNVQSFTYKDRLYISHNRLPRILPGSLGMKTGYIRASGYNVATTVERDGRRVVIVVIGGRSSVSRDRQVVSLAERTLPRARKTDTSAKISAKKSKLVTAWLGAPSNATLAGRVPDNATLSRDWKIQVGAFRASRQATEHLKRVRRSLGTTLQTAEPQTQLVTANGRQIYRARFANLSEAEAFSICQKLARFKSGCLPIAP